MKITCGITCGKTLKVLHRNYVVLCCFFGKLYHSIFVVLYVIIPVVLLSYFYSNSWLSSNSPVVLLLYFCGIPVITLRGF